MRKADTTNEHLGGVQKIYKFPNGYGASVVQFDFSYGADQELWELAVIIPSNNVNDFCLTFETPITDDVLGYLTEEDVDKILGDIENLPVRKNSS